MDKVLVYETITLNWTCPKCQTDNELRENISTAISDILECNDCGAEFKYEMSD